MDPIDCSNSVEIKLSTARLLIGKTMKTVQRWCDDGKIISRVVDLRGKRIVPLESVLPFTLLSIEDCHLIKQADSGNAEAQNELGVIFLEAGKADIAFNWFQEAAKSNHPDAMHWLFKYYVYGSMGVGRNEALAISWLAAAASKGHIIAEAQMRALYDRGHNFG